VGILLKIFQLLGAKFTKDFVVFLALKVFLTSLVLIALPIALTYYGSTFLTGIYDRVTDYASGQLGSSSLESVVLNVSGLTAFLINHLRLVDAFNVIITAIGLRVLMNLIPFSKV